MSILVLDFGSQYSHLICRRLREIGAYSELRSCAITIDQIEHFKPTGIILSGGPSSVYASDAPHLSVELWDWIERNNVPLLGICYGLQEMVHALGGKVEKCNKREFGMAELHVIESTGLFDEIPSSTVWMSHGDKVICLPKGFAPLASSGSTEFCAVADPARRFFGVQFHPEVSHTLHGALLFRNFCKIANCPLDWNMHAFFTTELASLKEKIGSEVHVVGAVSGGVDSTVAAALLHRAIGKRFHPFMIDTGLLRKDEAAEVKQRLEKHLDGMELTVIDESTRFFDALVGLKDPEEKRKVIGRLFIESFERAVVDVLGMDPKKCLLLQGTLYPDVIESSSHKGPSHTIKTHHNVGGLPERMQMRILEPLRMLFKDEVRALGRELGLPKESVNRHPFPGPGLAIRIKGEVTRKHADILREADKIFIEELKRAGEYDKISQALAILCPDVRTVGVMGDGRTFEMLCCLRAVESSDFMTADWYRMPYDLLAVISSRITNEVNGINRVCYDISSKPPATIEWE